MGIARSISYCRARKADKPREEVVREKPREKERPLVPTAGVEADAKRGGRGSNGPGRGLLPNPYRPRSNLYMTAIGCHQNLEPQKKVVRLVLCTIDLQAGMLVDWAALYGIVTSNILLDLRCCSLSFHRRCTSTFIISTARTCIIMTSRL